MNDLIHRDMTANENRLRVGHAVRFEQRKRFESRKCDLAPNYFEVRLDARIKVFFGQKLRGKPVQRLLGFPEARRL